MKKITLIPVLFLLMIVSTSFQAQLLPTSLKITVLDNLGNIVKNAEVNLYGNEEDYRNNENPIAEALRTDRKGRVIFKKLTSKSYFIDARKGDKNNDGEGVQTAKLKEGRVNKVNTVIE